MASSVSLPYTVTEAGLDFPIPYKGSRFECVTLMSKHEIPQVKKVLDVWISYLDTITRKLHESKESIDLTKRAHDIQMSSTYHRTYKGLLDSINMIIEDPSSFFEVLLAKDSSGEIQSAVSFSTHKSQKIYVTELLSASWNLRWNTASMNIPHPLRGGGVMLMDALCKIALKDGFDEVLLTSERTARPFYFNIGMTEYHPGAFAFRVKIAEDQEKIQSAMQRAFGPDFHYSLLISE